MGGFSLNISVVPEGKPDGMADAAWQMMCQIASQLRDTQELLHGRRPGHYAIREPRVVYSAVPNSAVDVAITVPGVTRWKVWALAANLTTSATAANRIPHLTITSAGGAYTPYNVPAVNNQPNGVTVVYTAMPGGVAYYFDSTNVYPLPVEVDLLQGWSVAFKTTNLQAGDQWTALSLLVTETLYF